MPLAGSKAILASAAPNALATLALAARSPSVSLWVGLGVVQNAGFGPRHGLLGRRDGPIADATSATNVALPIIWKPVDRVLHSHLYRVHSLDSLRNLEEEPRLDRSQQLGLDRGRVDDRSGQALSEES